MAVRRESVRLSLEDDGFSTGMAKAAASTLLLDRALDQLDGRQITIRQSTDDSTQGIDKFRRSSEQAGPAIDRLSGRLEIMAKAALVLGPSLIPIGAVAVPAITGLASQLGFAAIGMGSLVLATRGVGDALKAVNEAALEPTAENLEKARVAMSELGPEAQLFVARFQEIRPVLKDLRDSAAAGWFPGLTEALDHFELVAPRVASIFEAISVSGGRLVAAGAESLAGGEWAEFISFVEEEAPEALEELGRTIGNVALGLADLWMAFNPLSDDFSSWLLEASRGFSEWADGLADTQGFQDFVDYIRRSAPQVRDTLEAIARAVIEIIEAASPLGGPVLEAFELIANVLETIAGTAAGSRILTMAAAFVVLNKTLAATAALLAKTGFMGAAGAVRGATPGAGGAGAPTTSGGGPIATPLGARIQGARANVRQLGSDLRMIGSSYTSVLARTTKEQERLNAATARTKSTLTGFGKTAAISGAGVAAFAVASGALGDEIGLQNTAMLGLVGSMTGPWGAAVGAGIGLTIDLAKATGQYADAQERANAAVKSNNAEQITAAIAEQEKILKGAMDSDEVTGVGDFFSDVWRGATGGGSAEVKERAKKQLKELENALRGVTKESYDLARQKAIEEWSRSAGSAFLNLASDIEKPTISLSELNARMREQGRAAAQMGRNLKAAIENGADPAALQRLIDELGPQAGLVLEDLARGGEGAARRLNRAWGRSQGQLIALEDSIEDVGRAVHRLPDGTVIRISAETRKAASEIERIRREAQSVAGDYRINYIVTQTNAFNKRNAEAAQGLGPRYSGGYTGHGGKYEPAGVVHRGEVVLPQEIVARDRGMLKDRYGHLPGMDQLYTGGLAGYADGGRVSALGFADLPGLNLAAMNLKRLNAALRESERALDKERTQRENVLSKMTDLRSSVSDRITSTLFDQTDVWSSGGGVADALAILNSDIAGGRTLQAQIAKLKAKGLDGGALDVLLANADAATVANFAKASRAELLAYETAYRSRDSIAASVGGSASSAAYGAELRQQTREMRAVATRVERVERAIKAEGRETRRSSQRGARSGSRNRRRG